MNEAEWLACEDPNRLLRALDGNKWKGKLTAFAQACLSVHTIDSSGGWSVRAIPSAEQVQLIRCLCGNPFRKVRFNKKWRTDTVLALARTMYESREFGAMPILADALQDAGCDNDDILDHCHGAGPHVRGCWVVDLVLGKE